MSKQALILSSWPLLLVSTAIQMQTAVVLEELYVCPAGVGVSRVAYLVLGLASGRRGCVRHRIFEQGIVLQVCSGSDIILQSEVEQ